jgi:tetratricopeptide (TPR) repeat protein
MISTARRLASVAIVLLAWELAVGLTLTSSFFLAAPSTIVSEIIRLIGNGELPKHVQASMGRMLSGYSLALITGALLGALMGWFRWLDDIVDPIVELIRPVSPLAILPLAILWLGIGELQKVCQAIDHGNGFPQVMQTYTWLAQCFLDKGVPEAAIRWYEKALALPSLDQETRTALHYELASSYEMAQDKNHALHHFMEVYGSNIDYRDVGERIKALKS